jgi:hypothetical protein
MIGRLIGCQRNFGQWTSVAETHRRPNPGPGERRDVHHRAMHQFRRVEQLQTLIVVGDKLAGVDERRSTLLKAELYGGVLQQALERRFGRRRHCFGEKWRRAGVVAADAKHAHQHRLFDGRKLAGVDRLGTRIDIISRQR